MITNTTRAGFAGARAAVANGRPTDADGTARRGAAGRAIGAGLAGALMTSGAAFAQATADLSTWEQKGPAGSGTWTVQSSGGTNNQVLQSVNGQPTFFVTPASETFRDITVTGQFQVLNNTDNDYIGMVFGYQTPQSNGTDHDFFVFSWRQGNQSGDLAGFSLARTKGANTIAFGDMNSTDTIFNATPGSQEAYVRLATKTGSTCGAAGASDCSWIDNPSTTYDFFLEYDADRIQISIDGGVFDDGAGGPEQIFDVSLADFNATLGGLGLDPNEFLDGGGEFAEGNFGFFNFSQASVLYRDFSIVGAPVADADGPYQYSAAVLSQTADASATTDPTNDIVSYDWSNEDGALGSGETLPVGIAASGLTSTTDTETWTVLVTDDDGLTDDDTATVSYLNAGPSVDDVVVVPGGGSFSIDVSFSDVDFAVNALIAGFETATIELLDGASSVFATLPGLTGDGTPASFLFTQAELEAIFGGTGDYTAMARITDTAGASATSAFDLFLPPSPTSEVPVPATALLLGGGLAALGAVRRRRPA